MDVALSDLLICPRCGPTHGLVLLPRDVADRRVRAGVLGCPNCRERYPVEEGVADLRVGAETVASYGSGRATGPSAPAATERPGAPAAGTDGLFGLAPGAGADAPEVRLAGVMGLADAHGPVLLAGPAAGHGAALSALLQSVDVVVVMEGPLPAPARGVTRLRANTMFPFRSGSLRGVALTGAWASRLSEGARVLGGAGRLVVEPASADAREQLEAEGLSVLAEESGAVVAARRS